jgi:protein N-terminal amidase
MNDTKNPILNSILIQYHPFPRDISGNISKIEDLLNNYTKEDHIDIILFPEMALTGYIFDSKLDVEPFLEEYNSGRTFDFCSALSKKFDSYVFCGYPEKSENNLYNSCMITDRQGNALPSYRKHFLYEMDKTWCIEGDQFGYMEITTREGEIVKLGIGICMDLNPYEFTAPWEAMEFSTYCYKKKVDVILFLTNWLDNEPLKNSKKEILRQINYLVARLEPFLEKPVKRNVHFLAANRCGKERETDFIGCSCAVRIGGGSSRPSLLDNLDKKEEGTIFVECELKK